MSSNVVTLTELLIRERPALLRRVQRILGGDSGAEDVIQAVWFKARGVDNSQSIDNPRAYLYRLAINLATDHGRESTRRNRLLAEHYLWQEDEQISTEEQVMAQDELQRVLDAAGHLPEPTRTIFRLNRLQGLTQADIARRLGVSVTTVENHVRTALQRLAWARSGR
ncbi:RNA polymerase sigma factor [Stenotrophomonas lactitubi]|uniref:RNA polymerase sigma factor n=2 Tax=Stenotrophomonas TaxID=40323 RepID=UPI001E085179|nr:RNA polymerase sigma factor [Stenotrophomonas lactitubi]CAH0233352.1 putative RNA polymerase sigma factor FecI [Stenotrophomonas lactitubi]CAH0241450.1 putative RNA polymerase sigma factor FecI [Stenotrophomonas lactitubi]CAH0262087.1 putative RNA polymerase sigma factor FecI [Stenotrophomonas lactitubi]CAH0288221.1 putative RNA polymerase sigma factor FecI [Stenotrophomonas lactitubi]